MARDFFQKHSSTYVGNVDINSVGQKVSIKNDNLAKQNIFQVSRKKALPASYLRNTTISICPNSSHSSHVQGTCIISRDA